MKGALFEISWNGYQSLDSIKVNWCAFNPLKTPTNSAIILRQVTSDRSQIFAHDRKGQRPFVELSIKSSVKSNLFKLEPGRVRDIPRTANTPVQDAFRTSKLKRDRSERCHSCSFLLHSEKHMHHICLKLYSGAQKQNKKKWKENDVTLDNLFVFFIV